MIVYDNADTVNFLDEFWPSSAPGRILLTSRNPAAARGRVQRGYELPVMSPDDASYLLLDQLSHDQRQISSDADSDIARVVATKLGYLPLAIVQVAAFILETGCELSDTLRFLEDRKVQTELLACDGLGDSDFYGAPTAAAWDLSISALNDDSRDLLALLSFLDPDSIPEVLVRAKVQSETFEFRNAIGSDLRYVRLLRGGVVFCRLTFASVR